MNESMIKTERRSRMRYPAEQKKALIDAYRKSGLSAPRFCSLHDINYQTLIAWIKKEKLQDPEPSSRAKPSQPFSLVPAEIVASQPTACNGAMEVLLPGGTKFLISSPSHVTLAAALIRELNPSQPC